MHKQKSILIYCEGQTEYYYIEKLKKFFNDEYSINKNNVIIAKKIGKISKNLIDTCKKELQEYDRDYIFIITDREENKERQNILEDTEKYLQQNISPKYKDKIKIIVSNPTFEFWLYLHFKKPLNKKFTQIQLKDELTKITKSEYIKANEKWLETNIFNDFQNIRNAINNSKQCISKSAEKYEFCESNFYIFIEYVKNIKNTH